MDVSCAYEKAKVVPESIMVAGRRGVADGEPPCADNGIAGLGDYSSFSPPSLAPKRISCAVNRQSVRKIRFASRALNLEPATSVASGLTTQPQHLV